MIKMYATKRKFVQRGYADVIDIRIHENLGISIHKHLHVVYPYFIISELTLEKELHECHHDLLIE